MEYYLGEIRTFAGNYAPNGWVPCDGRLLPIADNEALYQLLGTTYGGNGIENFGIPNLLGRVPVGAGTLYGSIYSLGMQAGTENVTLLVQNLPSHTHYAQANNNTGTTSSPTSAVWAASMQNIYSSTTNNEALNPASIGLTGRNQPHNNMMPYTALTFFIAIEGIFPSST